MASGYKWIITRDLWYEEVVKDANEDEFDGSILKTTKDMTGTQGPQGCDERSTKELPDVFRLLDGDGFVMYEGVTDALTCSPIAVGWGAS